MACHALFNLVDLLVVGRLGREGLAAAINVASILVTAPLLVFDGICNAAVAVVAQAKGAGRNDVVHDATRDLMLLALWAAVLTCFPFVPLAAWVFEGYRLGEAAVVSDGAEYLRITSFGAAGMFGLLAATAALRGVGDSRRPAALLIGANALNLVLDFGLVFGLWGLPRLEAAGAAWATVAARVVACGFAAIALRRGAAGFDFRSNPRGRVRHFVPLIAKGMPSALQLVLRVVSFLCLLRIAQDAAGDGGEALNRGVNVAQRLDMTGVFVALGFGSAATALVGQNLGARSPARAEKAAWWCVLHAVAATITIGALLWHWRDALWTLIDPTFGPESATFAAGYWRWTLASMPFLAVGVVLARAMNGALDVRTPLWIDAACYLALLPLAAWVAGKSVGSCGVAAADRVWCAAAGVNVVAASAYALVFLRGAPGRALGRTSAEKAA